MYSMSEVLKDYVEATAIKIVDKPDEVKVDAIVSTKAIILQVKVHPSDCGKIIGKKGKTINALKVISSAIKNTISPQDSRRVLVEVLEEENSEFSYKFGRN